ncbi:hypothetical protein SARC_06420 [Sphaeroforma arctica JP610]|uniref:Uncharacterized protein n=1 Tax=Sphaeroforma arctica JP610 TaxID=667725 RepID=A0A0L0FWN1_9EUKA|nr:hypothetical protein SARC_06420 [Sphaeroforma arctica JP610]KNC81245.1 hypothetical protein SARC_06420 [Sphaeroforma arctica JP610]|eukprot:XP_014155147.1 hypothetical protein SARC_06420 [Sphaeroforma arctica JP610]
MLLVEERAGFGAGVATDTVSRDLGGETVDALVYTGRVHQRINLIKELLAAFLGTKSRLDVKRNVLIVTDSEFKKTLDLLRKTNSFRRFRVLSTPTLNSNTISEQWVAKFIENHDTLIIIDDAVYNCAMNRVKLHRLFEVAQNMDATRVRFAVIAHDYDTGYMCFADTGLSVQKRSFPTNTTIRHYLVEAPGRNSQFTRILRNIAILYAFAQSRGYRGMRDNLSAVHATLLFKPEVPMQYLGRITSDWLQCLGRTVDGEVQTTLVVNKPPKHMDLTCGIPTDLGMSQIADIATPEQISYLISKITGDCENWFRPANQKARDDVSTAYIGLITKMVKVHRVDGVAIVINNRIVPLDLLCNEYQDYTLLGPNSSVPEPAAQCLKAKRGYIHGVSTNSRKFTTVIDLFPALTRDPTTLMDVMVEGKDFTSFSFDMSISNHNTDTTHDLTHTDKIGTRVKYITHHLSSLMRLKPSASLYTYQSATNHAKYLKAKQREQSDELDVSRNERVRKKNEEIRLKKKLHVL